MNISAEYGTKVVFAKDERKGWGVQGNDNYCLTIGNTYIVERTEIHSSYTKVFIVEFPGKVFNSVCFE